MISAKALYIVDYSSVAYSLSEKNSLKMKYGRPKRYKSLPE